MAIIGNIGGMKINRAISSTTTVNASSYAIVDYTASSFPGDVGSGVAQFNPITRYFGPAQSVPATFTVNIQYQTGTVTVTYSIASGVEFSNI